MILRSLLPASTLSLGLLLVPSVAHAGPPNGGASMPDPPSVSEIRCVATPTTACPETGVARGGQAVVVGGSLDAVKAIVFIGRRGRRDDVVVRPDRARPNQLDVTIPPRTRSGRLELRTVRGDRIRSRARVLVRKAPTAIASSSGAKYFFGALRRPALALQAPDGTQVAADVVEHHTGRVVAQVLGTAKGGQAALIWDGRLADGEPAPDGAYRLVPAPGIAATVLAGGEPFAEFNHVFPIRGKHDLGQSHTNNFGGGRGHQGQDMFARCGTPVAAAQGGVVDGVGSEGAAGHFVSIRTAGTKASHVYMHLKDPVALEVGDVVLTGQRFGKVGATGRATGCHLHFELWPEGRFKGAPIDPLPSLRAWDAYS